MLANGDLRRAVSRNEQLNNTGKTRHAKWCAAPQKPPNMMPTDQLSCRFPPKLHHHHT
jgi:hypothetical protein